MLSETSESSESFRDDAQWSVHCAGDDGSTGTKPAYRISLFSLFGSQTVEGGRKLLNQHSLTCMCVHVCVRFMRTIQSSIYFVLRCRDTSNSLS